MVLKNLTIQLPPWIKDYFLEKSAEIYPIIEERMRLAVELSKLNVANETGGPFGAVIFDMETYRMIAPGVNLVVANNNSVAHAEMVAIMLAQQMIGHFDLSSVGTSSYELVTSTEPCAMCLGAIPWSGVRRVVCGARDQDARNIGFDEGHKPFNWERTLKLRGIDVISDILRNEASAALQHYHEVGGEIYNSCRHEIT